MSNLASELGQVAAVLGCQWGDEGKGKLVDILSEQYDVILRSAGGANAGHTIYFKDGEETKKFIFHLIPSGILHKEKICVVGNGCVVHLPTLLDEVRNLKDNGVNCEGRLLISDRAHLLFEYHKIIDGIQEERKGKAKVGTTKRGIGPCYADKVNRIGIRAGELLDFNKFKVHYFSNLSILKKMYGDFDYDTDEELEEYEKYGEILGSYIKDTVAYLHKCLKEQKNLLIEGANGVLLDIDCGTYPFVTSSNPSTGGLFTGSGIAPNKLSHAVGILKAYTTRVGAGPFPTELNDEMGELLREAGGEYGSTTGRPRRCGWFDAVSSKFALNLNGINSVNLTKLDVLSGLERIKIAVSYVLNGEEIDTVPSCLEDIERLEVKYIEMDGWSEDISDIERYEDLPGNCKKYLDKLEELVECSIKFIGVGQRRDQMIIR